MKKSIHIIPIFISLIISLTACTAGPHTQQMLDNADRIMESHPDSALNLLEKIDTVTNLHSNGERALYYLLLTQAQYKCYKPTTVDSLLDFSLEYYSNSSDKEKLARTYYYKASIAYDRKQYKESIPLFKKGLDLAEEAGDDELLSKYYENLWDANCEANDYAKSIVYAKKFLNRSIKMQRKDYIARCYSHIGYSYQKMDMQDSSDYYYRKMIPVVNHTYNKASSLIKIGSMYLRHNDLDSAKLYFKKSLDIKWHKNAAAALSEIYLREGNMEEARKMRDKAMKKAGPELRIKIQSTYADFLAKSGDSAGAVDIYKHIIRQSDSLRTANTQNIITELQLKYDKSEAENLRIKTKMQLLTILVLSVVGLLVFVVVGIIVFHIYRKNISRYTNIVSNSRKKITAILEQKQKDMSDMSGMIEELSKDKMKNEKEIEKLNCRLTDKKAKSLMRLNRGQELYTKLNAGQIVELDGDKDRECLVEFFATTHPQTYTVWKNSYEKLSLVYWVYLIVVSLKFSEKNIAAILGVSETTIRSYKSKLKKMSK